MTRYIRSDFAARPVLGINGMRLLGMRSGVGRMIEAFLRNIDTIDHGFSKIAVYSPTPIDDSIYLPSLAENVVVPSVLPNGLWEQFILPRAHARKGPLFCPSYVAPIFASAPVILTHHGSYEGYPEAFPYLTRLKARLLNAASARRADALSTVSEHSRGDIQKYYGVDAKNVEVIPEGVDTSLFRPITDETCKREWREKWIGSDTPYILYVGKATARRNLDKLVAAFDLLKKNHGWNHKLVFLGTKLPGTALDWLNKSGAARNDVIQIPFAEHSDVTMAYNCADVFVYPSAYEGFGMPVLEALACGTPTIALNNTAFPEFAGGIAWLLNDAEPHNLADAIQRLTSDSDEKQRMRIEGPKRAAEYDWSVLVRMYVDFIKKIAVDHHATFTDSPRTHARPRGLDEGELG